MLAGNLVVAQRLRRRGRAAGASDRVRAAAGRRARARPAAARLAAADALDSNAALIAVGETSNGFLWRFASFEADAARSSRSRMSRALRAATLVATGIVFGIALLLAIPTGTRRRPVADTDDENPADTFEEDESV